MNLCNELAILDRGRVTFHGSPQQVIAGVQGKVWTVVTGGERPSGNLVIISALQVQEGVQYRVLGDPRSYANAQPAQPTLEDGYIWLMRRDPSSGNRKL